MPKNIKTTLWHIGSFGVKALLLSFFVYLVLLSALFLRVSSSPLDISFAKSFIQSAMRDRETGNYAMIDKVVLFWPDIKGALFLQLEGGQVMNKQDRPILSIEKVDMSFSRAGLLVGRIMPKAIILQSPTLRLIRDEDGFSVDLGGGDTPEKQTEQLNITTRIFGYIARPGKESVHDSIIARLEAFSIKNARLVVDDQIAQSSWSLPDFNLKLYSAITGMKGEVDVKLPDVGLEQSNLHLDLDYLWDQKNVEVSLDVNAIDVKGLAVKVPELGMLSQQNIVVDAHVETILNEAFTPTDIRMTLSSESGEIVHEQLSEYPVPYKDLTINASYNYSGKTLKIVDTAVRIKDVTFHGEADITHKKSSVHGPVKIWIDDVEQSKIGEIWPVFLQGENVEKWVVKRMSKGTFKNMWARGNFLAEKKVIEAIEQPEEQSSAPEWHFDFQNIEAEFSAKGMDVDYRAPLEKATNVIGSGRFDMDTDELTIDIQKGKIGVMDVENAKMVFDKLVAVGEGDAYLTIPLKGKIVDVIRYVSNDPINLGGKINMDLKQVRGDADLNIGLKFPTQKDAKLKDFKIDLAGTLSNAVLPDVIETLDLNGQTLNFEIKDGKVKLDGKAKLDKHPVDFAWETYLHSKGKPFKEKITAKVIADRELRDTFGIDLDDFFEGAAFVDLTYTLDRNKVAVADVKVNAKAARFFISPLDFVNAKGTDATASFNAHFKDGEIQKITKLNAKGVGFTIPKAELFFAHTKQSADLSHGSFSNFSVADTNGSLEFSFDKSGALKLDVKADSLDARPFMNVDANEAPKGTFDDMPMKISATAQKMITAQNQALSNVSLLMDIDAKKRFNIMKMDGNVGEGVVTVDFDRKRVGKEPFSFFSDDAGALLKAFDVYRNIIGGHMNIKGSDIGGDDKYSIKGRAVISGFKVVKAPFLTKILSILSLTGVGEALSGDGLAFEKLEVKYVWEYRPKGSLLKLRDGRTSGNSIGLLFEGAYDNETREIDVSGTIVPMDTLNKVIGKIPLVGDILTGGSGGVFAATYSIKGKSEAPEIAVNPLSVLAPGIVRRVLFE